MMQIEKKSKKITTIELSQKGLIFKLQQNARKHQTRSLVGEITNLKTISFLKSQFALIALHNKSLLVSTPLETQR
jgi:hypothetical protein